MPRSRVKKYIQRRQPKPFKNLVFQLQEEEMWRKIDFHKETSLVVDGKEYMGSLSGILWITIFVKKYPVDQVLKKVKILKFNEFEIEGNFNRLNKSCVIGRAIDEKTGAKITADYSLFISHRVWDDGFKCFYNVRSQYFDAVSKKELIFKMIKENEKFIKKQQPRRNKKKNKTKRRRSTLSTKK